MPGELSSGFGQWVLAQFVAEQVLTERGNLAIAKAATIAGETLRTIKHYRLDALKEVFHFVPDIQRAFDLVVVGSTKLNLESERQAELLIASEAPILVCDALYLAKKEYPIFTNALMNRSHSNSMSVWQVCIVAACTRSVRRSIYVEQSLPEIIEAANTVISADSQHRLCGITSDLPERIDDWLGF